MSGLQNFVKRSKSGDGQNSQNGQPSGVTRAQIGANLKVERKKTILSHTDQQQSTATLRQNAGPIVPQMVRQPPPEQQPSRRQDRSQPKGDNYDTDAESLDTTVQLSVVQVEDSQKRHEQYAQVIDHIDADDDEEGSDHENSDGEDSYDDEDEGDGYEDHEEDFDSEIPEEVQMRQLDMLNMSPKSHQKYLAGITSLAKSERTRNMFDGVESYPSTTSGPPSNFPQAYGQNQDASSDFDGQLVSPSPQLSAVNSQQYHQNFEQPARHSQAALATRPPMPNHANTVQKAAIIRTEQRADTNNPFHGGGGAAHHLPGLALLPGSKTLPSSHAEAPTASRYHPPVQVNARQVRTQPAHAHQQGNGQVLNSVHLQKTREIQQPAHAKPNQSTGKELARRENVFNSRPHRHPAGEPTDLLRPAEKPLVRQQSAKEVHSYRQESVEDYDRPGLFDMDFNQLKNEDFDTDPRPDNPVLSEDMLDKPLADRLVFVNQSFNAEDKGKFFSSLPTREWEDAGDWFLDQFSSIINRTKLARQQKRKLAEGFEAEVEQRYDEVSKKQRLLESAKGKMKTQGQGLMPKSPRASKSPMPQKRK
ncbi:hypothetical protein K504DRAFT_462641 [Pleomassaria siparia CBS 279.74]|uniref:Extracellular mutant protein 11 C-terminal domain-containing protein n=1 Tax=Pleomassaria siparia CBS 279.74 TaxID=1314801 RepID=A0A6G1KNU6_9PLEO|nr:hypothetical protein K504DRAFT_462641 [Pleomassaria siparia CBS 279.74]